MSTSFNLPSPAGFRGLDIYKPVTIYYRNLPHWRQEGATYFVTFRLDDSLPREKLDYLRRQKEHWEQTHPPPRSEQDWELHTRQIMRQLEVWLDIGYGACHFRQRKFAAQLQEAILHFQNQRYQIFCSVVMPNHCHLVIRPFPDYELEKILQGLKWVVARRVNLIIGRSGSLWQEESYDRIVRDEEHLWRIVQYIGRNPELAGLGTERWRLWLDPDLTAIGWKFLQHVS